MELMIGISVFLSNLIHISICVTLIIFSKFFFLLLSLSFKFYPVDYLELKFTWLSIILIYLSFSILYFLNSFLATFRILNIFCFFLILNFCYKRISLWRQGENSNSIIRFSTFVLYERRKSFKIGISQIDLLKASVQIGKKCNQYFLTSALKRKYLYPVHQTLFIFNGL